MERHKLLQIICLCLTFVYFTNCARNIEGKVEKIYQSSDCRIKDARALGMESGKIKDSAITTSSEENKRLAKSARLGNERGAWTASHANRYQYLQIDLTRRMLITAVATQGRKGSGEYVTEYRLAFSDDGTTWRYYTNEFSMPYVFIGNEDTNHAKKNPLQYPIVARYIRFNPVRWMTRISMRAELYGCEFTANTASFADSYIFLDVSAAGLMIQNVEDTISLRFRTDQPDGVLLYADSNQGDYIILELRRGYLTLHINLGSTKDVPGRTSVTGGSLLDDGQWHDVIIMREKKELTIVVNRLETRVHLNGDFYRLDLDKKIYIGGLSQFKMQGLLKQPRANFRGCLENVNFNGAKLIRDASNRVSRYYVSSGVTFKCRMLPVTPITFNSIISELHFKERATTMPVRISLQFRTHNTNSVLIYTFLNKIVPVQDDSDPDRLEVKINADGFIMYLVKGSNTMIQDILRNTDVESITGAFNDGLWHTLTIYVAEKKVNCTVDGNSKVSDRQLGVSPTKEFHIGGYSTGLSFMGCMRKINIGNDAVDVEDLKDGASVKITGVTLGSCSIRDRCIPNPCEHGGICRQDWSTFSCLCGDTGYTGVTCRISLYPLSCYHFKMYSGSLAPEKTSIDIDGSGPYKPFPVICSRTGQSYQTTVTAIGHDSLVKTKVLGFADPGSYKREVKYDADQGSLVTMVERSYECHQHIKYSCNSSKLLARPQDFAVPTYAWWVGRSEQPMYYWGGAAYGTRSCACGLTEQGCRGGGDNVDDKPMCNCDANIEGNSADGGYLRDKRHLPVMTMYFGDTGSTTVGDTKKIGWHELGKLECSGDNLFDNVVTFRKMDATIALGVFDARSSGDIWFQFKTTQKNGVILHNTATNSEDFIQIRILDGETIFFSYNSGAGTANIAVKSASGLNDNQWHTVHLERNRKQALLKIDEQSPEVRSEEQADGYRTLDLGGDLVIGARVDNRDGFVGCVRGLLVNGRLMDLRGLVERGDVTYGVSVGCVGKCNSNPCFNGGTCLEEYSGYKCDCSYTPYRGWMCGREVGANINKGDFITYKFDANSGMSGAMGAHITIGFSTKLSQGILMQLRGEEKSDGKLEYISIELDNNGGVKIVLDVGFGREEINTPSEGIEYTNGQQHVLTVRRTDNGKIIRLQVDNYGAAIGRFDYLPISADALLNNPKVMYIGNNDSTTNKNGFEGCIYLMKFDNIFPLKDAFQDPREPHISFSSATIKEDMCGFEEVTQPPDPVEVRPGGGVLLNITTPATEGDDGWTIGQKIGLGIAGAIVLVLLLVVVFYFLFRGGVYRTNEAIGADYADNPDAALMYNQVGQPELSNVQEWFM